MFQISSLPKMACLIYGYLRSNWTPETGISLTDVHWHVLHPHQIFLFFSVFVIFVKLQFFKCSKYCPNIPILNLIFLHHLQWDSKLTSTIKWFHANAQHFYFLNFHWLLYFILVIHNIFILFESFSCYFFIWLGQTHSCFSGSDTQSFPLFSIISVTVL